MRKNVFFCVMALVAMGLPVFCPSVRAESDEPTLLVVPSHYTTVQIAFDVGKLRKNILLVSFSEIGVKTGQALYVWDGAAWVKTTFADYGSGSIFADKPRQVIIIGSEKDVPAVLGEVSNWCSKVKRISTLSIKDIFNSLNESFNFSIAEWRWLAKEYDLMLEDTNIERRRYGKYGKPGERTKAPMPVAPVPGEPKVEKPSAPVLIQSEVPETTTKKSSAAENK